MGPAQNGFVREFAGTSSLGRPAESYQGFCHAQWIALQFCRVLHAGLVAGGLPDELLPVSKYLELVSEFARGLSCSDFKLQSSYTNAGTNFLLFASQVSVVHYGAVTRSRSGRT